MAVIRGKVTAQTGEPLGGANVLVANTNIGAITQTNGTYTLTIGADAVRGQQVILTARYIGHKPATRTLTLTPGEQEQNFELATDPLRLEEVVVTGVAEATSLKKLPFTVSRVTEEQLQQVPGSSALVALDGKVAGVRLIPNSVQPGGEPSLRLRGATSIGGRQDPLVIVDGVITRFGLADIAGEDMERIEIVKGAAASAQYGSDAANGVVQVFTKRGSSLPEGALRVTSRLEGGMNQMPSRLEFSHHHPWQVDANGDYVLNANGGRIIKTDQISDNPFKVYYDHWDAVISNGNFWNGYVSVGQRQNKTNFNGSFENARNQGVIFGLGGYNRQNFRLNLDQQLRSNVDASFSAFYGTSTNGRAAEAQNGPFFGLMFLQPDVDIAGCCNPDGSKYPAKVPLSGDVANDFNPLYELANRKINQDRNRFTGSGRGRWRVNTWLQAEGSFAYDQEGQSYSDFTPFGYLTSSGTKTNGGLFQETHNNWQSNSQISLASVRHFGDITNTIKVAAIWENQRIRLPIVDELKLRASYGTAGLRPHFDDQYEILSVNAAGFTKEVLGNPLLKPARSAELEVGTNMEFGSGRYTFEYTYAKKKTTDQLLLVDLSASAGFKQQWQNTGALVSKTHELTFAARLINTAATSLTLNIVGDHTNQWITQWDLPERLYSFQQMPAAFFLGRGRDLGVLYGNRWVRNIDDLYADPAKAAQSGAGQRWSRDSVMINEDGYVVRKGQYGKASERAIKYAFCKLTNPATGTCLETSDIVRIGDANPDFNLGFSWTFTHRRFALNGTLFWSYGGQLYNGTRQWAFQATRDRVQDQAAKPANDATCGTVSDPMPSCPQKAIAYYGVGFYNGLSSNDFFVENASYAKLKELALHYTLGRDQLRGIGLRSLEEVRVGLIGRNLFTITKYTGLDPEVSGLFGDPFQVRMDWFQYPQFRSFSAVVEITY